MATPDLSGVMLKLDRANEHIETLSDQLKAFLARDPAPFGFRTEERPGSDDSVEYVLYAVVREQPPREFGLVIGDAVHNLRSALDHLVYELATPRARRSIKLQFPIFKDECEFKVRSPPNIKSITGDERTLIERLQPYRTTNPENDPLAILRELSNLDKHRLIVTMIATTDLSRTFIGTTNADCHFTFIERGPVEHDAKIVAFTARPEDPTKEMHVHPQSALEVGIANTGATHNMEAGQLLGMLHSHVEHSVVNRWFKYGSMPPENPLQT